MGRTPAAAGLTVVDCTEISIGNSDIEASSVQGDVRPQDVRPGMTALPIYPQPWDMPQLFIVRELRKGGEL